MWSGHSYLFSLARGAGGGYKRGMDQLTRDQLLALARDQQQTIARLTAELHALRDQLDQLRKEAARSAAPFRRPDAKKIPPDQQKKPGRPAGHPGVNRRVPDRIDATVTVPLADCPRCHGPVRDVAERVQYVEEIPVVTPTVTKVVTFIGRCACCGDVESTHPLQTGRGTHASAVHLGPRAIAMAAVLNKHHGIPMRKTCRLLKDAFGLTLSAGGLSQALDRLADRCETDYQHLIHDVRAGPAAYADETSWWVGGPGHWLHVVANPTTILYRVEASRGSEVVTETLTPQYAGVLVSDCLNIYDTAPIDRKHKCLAHHQKAIREQLDSPGLGDRTYLERWKGLFELVCETTAKKGALDAETVSFAHTFYTQKVDALLAQPVTQDADRRIQNRLRKQREHLLTCLADPSVEATNNRAERALRPAVIARKVSCGNRTARGKRTWERLTSLAATLRQRGQDLLAHLTRRATLPRSQPPG